MIEKNIYQINRYQIVWPIFRLASKFILNVLYLIYRNKSLLQIFALLYSEKLLIHIMLTCHSSIFYSYYKTEHHSSLKKSQHEQKSLILKFGNVFLQNDLEISGIFQ